MQFTQRTSRRVLEVKLETVADTANRYAPLYHGAVSRSRDAVDPAGAAEAVNSSFVEVENA